MKQPLAGIDHIVIAVRDLALASTDYERAGFTVTPGGEHSSGDTHNALISFADGSYLELIAFREPDRPRQHPWWSQLARGEGLVDFALGAEDLAARAQALRARGLDVEGPAEGGRTRPDGHRLAWRTIIVHDAARSSLPFLIEDITPRHLRVPGGAASVHPLGVVGVAAVTLVVPELARSAEAFAALTGSNAAHTAPDLGGVRAASRFAIDSQWITLLEPDESASEMSLYREKRGAGPFEIQLRTREAASEAVRLLPMEATHGARIRIIC